MLNDKSFADKIKSFDVYRKLPKGYLQPTLFGACCNIRS